MEKVKKAPAIRFRAYNRDWKQLSLDQHASFLKGKGYKKEDLKSSGQEIILYGKMYTDYKTAYTKSDTFVNLQQGSVLSQAGDVIVPASGETAEEISIASAILKDNIILGGDINIIRPTGDLDPIFLALSISTGSVKNELTKMAEGATIAHLRNNNLKKVTVVAPHLEEQTQIGNFFKNLDEKLELEKEKHEKLKNFKKAMLEDMFPKEGEKVPKVRFEGFDDEWQGKELSTIVQITMGQSPSSSNYSDFSNEGLYILIQGNADLHKRKVVPRVWTSQVTRKADRGDIIMSVRAPAGTVGKTEYDAVIGRGVASIKGNEFIYQMLIKMEDSYWEKISTGSTFDSIDKKTINEAVAFIPEVTEQTLIGNFFKNLDEKIALSEKKIAKIENFKKAMLEKMFV